MNDFPGTPASPKRPLWRRTWLVATATGLLCLGIGAAVAMTDVTDTAEYRALTAERDEARTALTEREADVTEARTELDEARAGLATKEQDLQNALGDIPGREKAVAGLEEQLAERQAAVTAQEKKVRRREKAVGIVEREIAANTVSGDGLYEVGRDLKAGTYRSSGSQGCYYAILSSPDTNDIATNNLTDGPAIVALRAGTYFTTTDCADWVWQR